jgi:hypothetical protein
MSNNATKPKPTKKTRHKPSEKTKKRLRRARRGKAKCTGPPKARKLRSKRKLALLERRTRGSGPPVRNVESSVLGSNRDCTRCSRRADHVVIWEYWLGGYWRQAKRHQCAKHAGKLAARLGRAR